MSGEASTDLDLPLDRTVDRRAFLTRIAALTAMGAAGGAWPAVAGAHAAGPAPGATWKLPPLPDPGSIDATDPAALTIAEAASLLRERTLSPSELVQACLRRIDAHEELYQAFNAVLGDGTLDAARRLDGAHPQLPLHGIPLAIKDNFYTAGIPTTANSHLFRDFVPTFDATCVARLRGAGALILGKTQMGPLATTAATTPDGERTTVNAWAPYHPAVSPGGSSSGSATAVAAGMALAATGTQTGGSITTPAAAQGLTGLKPTMGRVSLYGVIPLTYTRDHPGPLARDARDAALLLQAIAGPDRSDPRTLGLPPVPDYSLAADPVERSGRPVLRWSTRVGVFPDYTDPGHPEAEARMRMLETLEGLGGRVVQVEPPEDWEVLTGPDFNNVRLPERTEPFMEKLREDVRLFGVSLSPWINGLLLSGDEYLRGQRAKLLLLRRVLDGIFEQCDVIAQTSPIPFDIIGLPLISFPVGMKESEGVDLPIGALFGAPPFGEERLLSLAGGYQAVTDWHRRRPQHPERLRPVETGASGANQGMRAPDARNRHRIDVRDVMDLGQ
jgi:Asp-tRNA(Asn)/Glu-tRNA(Gln) amidotransferase A subunit family amidase